MIWTGARVAMQNIMALSPDFRAANSFILGLELAEMPTSFGLNSHFIVSWNVELHDNLCETTVCTAWCC